MAYNVLDIANKLIAKAAEYDAGDLMSNMRLQKMLYYEQGYHIAAFGTPLFEDEVEAWMYGPVVPCVYEHFKEHGANSLPMPESENIIRLAEDEEYLFNDVFEAYLDFSTYGLMRKTHNEDPWCSVTMPGLGSVISKESMDKFFKRKLVDA